MQQTFQCTKCGAQNYAGHKFCWNCGTSCSGQHASWAQQAPFKKKRSPWLIGCSIVAGTVILIIGIVLLVNSIPKSSQTPAVPSTQAPAAPSITPPIIYRDFCIVVKEYESAREINGFAARETFGDTPVRVTGTVNSVYNYGLNLVNVGCQSAILCKFDTIHRSSLLNLRKGQTITVKGKFNEDPWPRVFDASSHEIEDAQIDNSAY